MVRGRRPVGLVVAPPSLVHQRESGSRGTRADQGVRPTVLRDGLPRVRQTIQRYAPHRAAACSLHWKSAPLSPMRNVVIIGAGCAGNTAAVYAARANLKPLVVGGHHAGGQLSLTTLVENFPGFPEGINGPDLVENMRKK